MWETERKRNWDKRESEIEIGDTELRDREKVNKKEWERMLIL